jgi:hypothetical protein
MEMSICSNTKQQLLASGITAIQDCPCKFTDHDGIIKVCNHPFADHKDEGTQG